MVNDRQIESQFFVSNGDEFQRVGQFGIGAATGKRRGGGGRGWCENEAEFKEAQS